MSLKGAEVKIKSNNMLNQSSQDIAKVCWENDCLVVWFNELLIVWIVVFHEVDYEKSDI